MTRRRTLTPAAPGHRTKTRDQADRGAVSVAVAIGGAGLLLVPFLAVAALFTSEGESACVQGVSAQPQPARPAQDGIPAGYLALYRKAGQAYGIGWNVLAAIGKIESGHGANMGPSSAGALGQMQFMPGTWAQYGGDGNGDGRKDIRDPADAIPAAARLLKANGAPGKMRTAIWHYNHVRHEALLVRMEVRDRPSPRCRSSGVKLEAA